MGFIAFGLSQCHFPHNDKMFSSTPCFTITYCCCWLWQYHFLRKWRTRTSIHLQLLVFVLWWTAFGVSECPFPYKWRTCTPLPIGHFTIMLFLCDGRWLFCCGYPSSSLLLLPWWWSWMLLGLTSCSVFWSLSRDRELILGEIHHRRRARTPEMTKR